MSSIFAWNMRGFNQPRKQKAVRYWIKAAKLSFGCLIETKVKEEFFLKCVLMRCFLVELCTQLLKSSVGSYLGLLV